MFADEGATLRRLDAAARVLLTTHVVLPELRLKAVLALIMIYRKPGVTIMEIAVLLRSPHSTTFTMLSQLREQYRDVHNGRVRSGPGLIEDGPLRDDARYRGLVLTPKGVAALKMLHARLGRRRPRKARGEAKSL
ncbi:DNA-binding MarR family transcriptional regulator [Methylopila capsulata]|uniref:DNA-binding MarR family transcriptional regulator n=1 Tax=Methylopila capsulata TaxID=61654 RepID=A0A9W6IVM6_9HYPH|nr:hypothetical protein [Methylopila capsulata]MBM7850844.1 DNA-binding MarR family transcriptional regulator [Methylopila capsulata]GLK56139.1 hypothetical protein GCM10008170_21580 [Methylopila capsulata]